MGKLVVDEIYKLLESIPDNDFNLDNLIKILSDAILKVSKICGVAFKKAIIYENEKKDDKLNSTDEIVFWDNNIDSSNDKEYVFQMGNGGVAKVIASTVDNLPWDKDKEEDFVFLSKLFFMIYGRARVMNVVEKMTYTDSLTGVSNEEHLYKYMGSRLSMGTFSSYCSNFVNIKNMKLFNNRYGTPIGDKIIEMYAKKIESFVGDKGCVARLGGDNFIVFIESKIQNDFLKFADSIYVDICNMDGETDNVKINSRIGYCYLKPGNQIYEAMNHSSIALMMARQDSSTDVVMFTDEMRVKTMYVRKIEDILPDALANEEFVVYYQPKADISENGNYSLFGAEALVRWQKDGQMVPPMEFIPIMEKNGLVTKIDFYVFECVCKHIKEWEEKGCKPVRISVNFSRRHLMDEDFANKIESIIHKYDVNPKLLEIEITESYDIEDIEVIKVFERNMHNIGLFLAVDDFGRGFSSIRMIKNIAADTIKLDKSIIDGIGYGNYEDEIIVSSIIRMIKGLGKEIIAEGVEYSEQAEFLRNNGCNMIQGFLYQKPMPKEQFELML